MIDLGWAVAVLWGALRMVAVLWLRRASGGYEAAWFLDPVLILLLAYGLYRRSRVCAVLLLAYVVVELWFAFHAAGRPTGLGVALLLEVSFLTGLRGALLYRREMGTKTRG
jgi:serine/threonine-protein kinase